MLLEICIGTNRRWGLCTQLWVVVDTQQPPLLIGPLARADSGRAAASREALALEPRGTRTVAHTCSKFGGCLATAGIGNQFVETCFTFWAVGVVCPSEDCILGQDRVEANEDYGQKCARELHHQEGLGRQEDREISFVETDLHARCE